MTCLASVAAFFDSPKSRQESRTYWRGIGALTTAVATSNITLHRLKLLLQRLNCRMCALQILVQAITLTDKLLLPLSETVLLNLNLLREPLSEVLFLFLKLGVIKLSWSRLTEFTGLHLLSAVGFVVRFFGGVDEIQHVSSDENGAEFLEVAVVLVLDLGDSPGVLAAFDDTAIAGLDVFLGADDGEWHSCHKGSCVLCGSLVILLDGWCVDLDALGFNDSADL